MQHLHSSIQKQGTTLDLTTILTWILGMANDFFVTNNKWCHTRFGSRTWYFLGTPGWGAPSHIDQVPFGNLARSTFFTSFPFEHLRSKNEFKNQSKSFTLPNNKRWYASYDWLTTFCTCYIGPTTLMASTGEFSAGWTESTNLKTWHTCRKDSVSEAWNILQLCLFH